MIHAESKEQRKVIDWFRWQYRDLSKLLVSVPNGSHLAGSKVQRARQMVILKGEGLQPGFPDLFLFVPNKDYHGLAIEMKAEGKTKSAVTDNQDEMIKQLNAQGYKAVWCAGANEAIKIIKEYL